MTWPRHLPSDASRRSSEGRSLRDFHPSVVQDREPVGTEGQHGAGSPCKVAKLDVEQVRARLLGDGGSWLAVIVNDETRNPPEVFDLPRHDRLRVLQSEGPDERVHQRDWRPGGEER